MYNYAEDPAFNNTTYQNFSVVAHTLGLLGLKIHRDRVESGYTTLDDGVNCGYNFESDLIHYSNSYSYIDVFGIYALRFKRPLKKTIKGIFEESLEPKYHDAISLMHDKGIIVEPNNSYTFRNLLETCGLIGTYTLLVKSHHKGVFSSPLQTMQGGFGTSLNFLLKTAIYQHLNNNRLAVAPEELGIQFSRASISYATEIAHLDNVGIDCSSHIVESDGSLNKRYLESVTRGNKHPCIINYGLSKTLKAYVSEVLDAAEIKGPTEYNLYNELVNFYYPYIQQHLVRDFSLINKLGLENRIDRGFGKLISGNWHYSPFKHDTCPIISAPIEGFKSTSFAMI